MPIRPKPGSLSGGAADVEPGDQPQDVDLHAFDPADGDAEQATERELDTGAARGPGRRSGNRRASPCRWRWAAGQRRPRGWPPARRRRSCWSSAPARRSSRRLTEGIAGHGRLYFRNELLGLRSFDGGDQHRCMAVPAGIRGPVVDLHRPAPGDLVEARVAGRAALLDDDPAVVREDAFPAPGARRKHVDGRVGFGARRRQDARTRPVGPVPRNGSRRGKPTTRHARPGVRERRRQRRGGKTGRCA